MQKIFIGSDHGGFKLKNDIKTFLEKNGISVEDVGCFSAESCDYPIFGALVGQKVIENPHSVGIVICGSGVGVSIASNKIKGARCVLANSCELARLGRAHNGANILAMGERTQFIDSPINIVETFLNTDIDMAERHERRRKLLDTL